MISGNAVPRLRASRVVSLSGTRRLGVRRHLALSFAAFVMSAAIGTGQESGLLTGQVVDSVTSAPVPGAILTVTNLATGPVRERPRTDASGRFAVRVPTGRYEITATKAGSGEGAIRQTSPLDPGGWVSVSPGSSTETTIRLWRGAVISGRVTDGHAEGLGSVPVRLFRRAFVAGSVRLLAAGSATSDDRGAYRFTDVRPGAYVVGVLPMNTAVPARWIGDTAADTPAGLGLYEQMALQDLPSFTAAQSFGSVRLGAMVDSLQPRRVDDAWVAPVSTFYPGVSDPAQAGPIQVRSGDDVPGIDLTVLERPTVSVSGRLAGGGAALSPYTAVRLVPTEIGNSLGRETYSSLALADSRGQFVFPVVTPGHYLLLVHRTPTGPTDLGYWASETLNVQSDVTDLTVLIHTGLKITGRIQPGTQQSVALQGTRVRLERSDGAPPPRRLNLTVESDGTFVVGGAPAGRYVLRFTGLGEWSVTAASSPAGELHNRAFDLSRDIENAQVTITSVRSSVRGVVHDEQGAPSGNCLVLLLPEDRSLWSDYGATPVYLQSQRPSPDGEFAFAIVPRGDYRLVAVGLGGKEHWSEPAMLAGLAARGKRISVAAGATVNETLVVLK